MPWKTLGTIQVLRQHVRGGVGGLTQIADIADALRGGGGSGAGMLM